MSGAKQEKLTFLKNSFLFISVARYDQVQRFQKQHQSTRLQPDAFRRFVITCMRRCNRSTFCPYHNKSPGSMEHRCPRMHPADGCEASLEDHIGLVS